ncbi:SGNH/GDSL hydrolase family protein [Roseateles oligotrophus]|uniref:PEP-CTERM sorting domain-containing protein n=1 Tax=Roseateles oligotrophus TaxID=1769250 RepID=A0ABT2Y8L5_9BURK|nr:SGNH/GDSL hydrolase family protein [Roseateles oligotrophus]MCV2366641.1 PEP-CTERM sorting domain-containing protein [Roseateles oligotrophus]
MSTKIKLTRGLLSAAILAIGALGTVASLPAHAAPFSSVVIFGDSLSDSGNNYLAGLYNPAQVITGNTYIPSFTYDKGARTFGTYSNGATWATQFTASLGLSAIPSLAGGTNYVFGGAVTSGAGFPYSLTAQVGQFLAAHPAAPSDALYVIEGGGNNLRAAATALSAPGLSFAQQISIISDNASRFATDIGNMVDSLQAAGAHNIIVWNTPNFAATPFAGATGSQYISGLLGATMNSALDYRLSTEAGVKTFDVFGLISTIAANPAAYGLSNISDACGAAINNCDPATALYWDAIHPTAKGHQILADAMMAAAVPEPSSYLLFAVGLAGMAAWQRRRV